MFCLAIVLVLEIIATLVNHNGKSFIKFTQITTCGLSLITNKLDQISTKIILYPSAHSFSIDGIWRGN